MVGLAPLVALDTSRRRLYVARCYLLRTGPWFTSRGPVYLFLPFSLPIQCYEMLTS